MAGLVERLTWRLGVSTEGTKEELRRVNQEFRRFSKNGRAGVVNVNKSFGALRSNLVAIVPALGALSAAGIINGFRVLANEMGSMADAADKLGISVETLQELRFAAVQSGISVQTLEMGMQRFTRRVAEAQVGTGELLGTLQQYDIEVRNADGTVRSSEQVLRDYADAIQNAETEQERLRMAFKAFDSEGAVMVNMLRNGSDGLMEYAARAAELGVVISEDLVIAARDFDRQLDTLILRIETQFKAAILDMAQWLGILGPTATSVAEDIADTEATITRLGAALVQAEAAGSPAAAGLRRQIESLRAELAKLQNVQQALEETTAERSVGPVALPPPEKTNKAIEAMKIQVRQLERLRDAQAEGAEAIRQANEATAVENAYRRAGIDATSKYAGQVRFLTQEEIRLRQETEQNTKTLQMWENAAESAFDNAFQHVRTFATEGGNALDSLRNIGLSVVNDLQSAFWKFAVTNPLKAALFGDQSGGGVGGGLLGGVIGNIFQISENPDVPVPARQSGGFAFAGETYRVNEHGHEFFTPSVAGRITPAGQAAGPTNNYEINVSTGVQETVAAEIDNRLPDIAAAVTAMSADQHQRGGAATTAARRRLGG